MPESTHGTIGFLCPSRSWGGLEMNVVRIADWLTRRDWRVILYGSTNSRLIRQADEAGLPVRSFDIGSKLSDVWRARRLARQCDADRLDHLVVHLSRAIQLGVLCRRWSSSNFTLSYLQQMQLGMAKRDPIHSWLYRQLDGWISPLGVHAQLAGEWTAIPPERIFVAELGIETDRFTRRLPDRVSARKRFLLPDDLPVIGLVGRLDPQKGHETVVRAAYELHKRDRPVRVLFVGDRSHGEWANYHQQLVDLTSELGIEEFVSFHQHVSEIEYAYAASDIFAMATHSETFGLVTIEAMTSGLPVVGTNAGGTPGIIAHEQNGLLVPPQDEVALADALQRLLDDRTLRNRLADQARKDAVKRFSHHVYCKRLEEILLNLKRTR